MDAHNAPRAPRRLAAVLLTSSLGLAGCIPAPLTRMMELPGDVAPEKHSIIITQPRKFANTAADMEKYARKFALMALFAKTVYRHDLLDDKARSGAACSYLGNDKHRDVLLDMPQGQDGSGWARWSVPGACYSEDGLYFETYVHRTVPGVMDEAVIAIRGTENYSLAELRNDWGANLSGVFPHAGDEYARAAAHIRPLIHQLAGGPDATPSFPIYLTGHSLGGGIAQYLAYLHHPKVKATFTFNTSPVTHWSQLPPDRQTIEPTIHRVYMNNEFLSYVREITSRFNAPRFQRKDYQFFFVNQDLVGAHDMSHLACQFAARLGNEPGKHHYSLASARATLNSPVLCPNHVLAEIPAHLRDPR